MKHLRLYWLPLFIVVLLFVQPAKSQQLIYDVTIVEVETGKLIRDAAVYIEKGKIQDIGLSRQLQKMYHKTTSINGNGKYLIPGLWDMHIHLEGTALVEDNEALLPIFLAYGITTVRDCASDLGLQVLAWRDEVNTGKRIGPTIYTAGRKLEGKNSMWKGDLEIANEAELKAMLDTLDRDKVDFIKITENTLGGDLFIKSVSAAHARGYRVSGHVPLDVSIDELVSAGYTSVEHASYMLRLGRDEAGIVAGLRKGTLSKAEASTLYSTNFDQAKAKQAYTSLASKGLFVCPTLIGSYQLAYLKETDHSKDAFLQYLSKSYVSNYAWRIERMANETPAQLQQRKDALTLLKTQLPLMLESGITLMAGSDAAALNTYVYPAESLLQELEIFADAGLSSLQILQSATLAGAKYFKVQDRTASIQKNKDADLVLLDANPLEDIRNLRKVYGVIKKGTYYNRGKLDAMLASAKATKEKLDQKRAQ
jgi:imidazolonepropionase-like amidohydrolase